MVAATKYTEEAILDAAAMELASAGFEATSVASIARSLGAPSGSIYHRFESRKHLIGALWVRTVRRYADSLGDVMDGAERADLAGRIVDHTFDWVAGHPVEAQLLMRFRTEDLVGRDWPPEVIEEITDLNQRLATRVLAIAHLHEVNALDMTFAAIDIPAAAARRSILLQDAAATFHLRDRATQLVEYLIMG